MTVFGSHAGFGRPCRGLLAPGAGLAAWAALSATAAGQCQPQWSSMEGGISLECNALAVTDPDGPGPMPNSLFVGGGFAYVAYTPPSTGLIVPRLARWDGWKFWPTDAYPWPQTPPGNNYLLALRTVSQGENHAPSTTGLYPAGEIGFIDGIRVSSIARRDDSRWDSLSTGIEGYVHAEAPWRNVHASPRSMVMYVSNATVPEGRSLCIWNGRAWSFPAGGLTGWQSMGVSPKARAFAAFDDDGPGPRPEALYVGGSFDYAGNVFCRSIARWDGTAWEALGEGVFFSAIYSLCAFDEDGPGPKNPALFIGGGFKVWSNPEIRWMARWDGLRYSEVEGRPFGLVRAMTVWDDDGPGPRPPMLYIGGYFTTVANGLVVNSIARWDGRTWYPLGSGLTGFGSGTAVHDFAHYDEDGDGPNPGGLYVGGRFWYAGGIQSLHVARWGCPMPPACSANCSRDFDPVTGAHVLTIADFACFQTRFVLQDPYADCDASGSLTIADFGCFQTKFVQGCP